ncbi:hypothetical protein CR513_42446, partial [Mucuna pruriens]
MKAMLATPPILNRPTPGWTIQLSEFDISFERRGHIKAQALANFITKLAQVGHNSSNGQEWFLSIDGVLNQRGSGACVILEGPDKVLIEQSLQFEFKASNNQAEYEAFLAGIKLAKELEAQVLMAKRNSKIVTGQNKATKLATSFEKFTLLHVP